MTIEEYLLNRPEFQGHRVSKRGELATRCPFHTDRSPSFSVNVRTGVFLCRSAGCGVRGGFHKLFRMLEGVSGSELARRLQSLVPSAQFGVFPRAPTGDEEDENPFRRHLSALGTVAHPQVQPPPVYPSALVDPWSNPQSAAYLKGRGISEQTTRAFSCQLGLAPPVTWRLVLPYYDRAGQYLTWTARTILKTERRRYSNPEWQNRSVLYGEHVFAAPQPAVAVVEGPFDVLRLHTLGIPAVGLSGLPPTVEQIPRLRSICLSVPDVVIMLDLGAERIAAQLSDELFAQGVRSRVISMGTLGVKDPGLLPDGFFLDRLLNL